LRRRGQHRAGILARAGQDRRVGGRSLPGDRSDHAEPGSAGVGVQLGNRRLKPRPGSPSNEFAARKARSRPAPTKDSVREGGLRAFRAAVSTDGRKGATRMVCHMRSFLRLLRHAALLFLALALRLPAGAQVPDGWTSLDIGSPSVPGLTAVDASAVWHIRGSGRGGYDNTGQFQFWYRPVSRYRAISAPGLTPGGCKRK